MLLIVGFDGDLFPPKLVLNIILHILHMSCDRKGTLEFPCSPLQTRRINASRLKYYGGGAREAGGKAGKGTIDWTLPPLFSQTVNLCVFIIIILGNVPAVNKRYVRLHGHLIDTPLFFSYYISRTHYSPYTPSTITPTTPVYRNYLRILPTRHNYLDHHVLPTQLSYQNKCVPNPIHTSMYQVNSIILHCYH